MNRTQRGLIGLVGRPGSVAVLLILCFVGFLLAPTIDDAISAATNVETDRVVFTDLDELGWRTTLCRERPRTAKYDGMEFHYYPIEGGVPFPVRVWDVKRDVEAGSSRANLKAGCGHEFFYTIDLPQGAREGDRIVGTAHYKSRVGWWSLSDFYGEVTLPPFPELPIDDAVQSQLKSRGQGIEELTK